MFVNRCILFFAFITLSVGAFGQQKTKAQLQKERQENLKKIEEASKTLQQTATKKKSSVGELNALKYQIEARQNVIRGIEDEISLLDTEITDNLEIIAALEQDLVDLKNEYSAMVYAAYKARSGRSKLTFLFAASSFNQLLRRLEYMEQYAEARKKQVDQIMAVQDVLLKENKVVTEQRAEKSDLLTEQIKESKSLESMKSKQQSVLADLQKQEKQIKKELANRRKSLKALDALINDIIKREAEAAAKAAAMADNKAAEVLSADFSKNKAKLPWPTSGFISQKFGRSRDPVLKMVERNSPGIEIQTSANSDAESVFSGEVRAVALIPGFNKAVIVKHGDYFTVYAKLDKVYVQKGETVSVGDKIGSIFTDDEGLSELHFELWQTQTNGTVKLNPETWLLKK